MKQKGSKTMQAALTAISSPRALRFWSVADHGYFIDERGKRSRIIVAGDRNHDLHRTKWSRAVIFVDEGAVEYMVDETMLEPASEDWTAPQHAHLEIRPDLALIAPSDATRRTPSRKPVIATRLRASISPIDQPWDGAGTAIAIRRRDLTKSQIDRLANVELLLDRSEDEKARNILRSIQTEVNRTKDRERTDADRAEVVALETRRGSELDVHKSGRIRVCSRGGLQLAYERGDLANGRIGEDRLYETAKIYREAFETVEGQRGKAFDYASAGGSGSGKPSPGPQGIVFELGAELAIMRKRLTRKQLAVINRVCGLDMPVFNVAKELRAGVPSVKRSLRGALTVAAQNRADMRRPKR